MPNSRTYSNVNIETWSCIRAKSIRVYGTSYVPSEGNKGIATTITLGQKVVLGFEFDAENETLTYTIISKGILVPEKAIWNGIGESIKECGGMMENN